jgi:hypothetical protein
VAEFEANLKPLLDDIATTAIAIGGWVRGSWRRLRRWVEDERKVNRSPNVGEWWQWLAELLERDPDPGKAAGAHVSYTGPLWR